LPVPFLFIYLASLCSRLPEGLSVRAPPEPRGHAPKSNSSSHSNTPTNWQFGLLNKKVIKRQEIPINQGAYTCVSSS